MGSKTISELKKNKASIINEIEQRSETFRWDLIHGEYNRAYYNTIHYKDSIRICLDRIQNLSKMDRDEDKLIAMYEGDPYIDALKNVTDDKERGFIELQIKAMRPILDRVSKSNTIDSKRRKEDNKKLLRILRKNMASYKKSLEKAQENLAAISTEYKIGEVTLSGNVEG